MSKHFLFFGFICSMVFGSSFCTHPQKIRNLSSPENPGKGPEPKIVQTPAGRLYVYHKVFNNEPVHVTYVDVKYKCQGSEVLKDWKRFKVQWFYGVDKTLPESVIPLVYDPIAKLNLSGSDSPDTTPVTEDDTKRTVREEFNLRSRCLRDQRS